MYLCKYCNRKIRWTELHGWVHGANGEGYVEECVDYPTKQATPRDEDMEWLRGPVND